MIKFRSMWMIFVVALALRLIYVIFCPQLDGSELSDAWVYDGIAKSIASGEGTTDVRWAPLYPQFLSCIYRIFGSSFFAVRIVQSVISSLTCMFIYLIGKEVFGKRIGLIAGWLAVLYPAFISYSGLVLSETLTAFLIVISLYVLIRAVRLSNNVMFGICGLFLGLLALCRAEMLLLPIFIFVGMIMKIPDRKKAIMGCIIISVVMGVVIAPRTIRNYKLYKRIIPITVGLGRQLWIGSYHEDWGEWHYDKEPIKTLYENCSQIEINDNLMVLALQNIKQNPLLYVKFSIKKFFRFWIGSHSNTFKGMQMSFDQANRDMEYGVFAGKMLMLLLNLGIVVLGFLGMFMSKKSLGCYFLMSVIVYKVVLHMVLFSTLRFQVPVMPLVLIFSAMGIKRTILKTD